MTNSKIVRLEELATVVGKLKMEGKSVAQCHGCFDLLHLGHIKHFQAAKRAADIVVVTITPDRFVNKGPGRPVFNENLRMEAIAALQAVDYVALNKWETAIETIKALKPTFYVKGQDYIDRDKDITKNIFLEEDAVKAVGGSILFTEEIAFSSSTLVNAHFSPYDEKVQNYMHNLKGKFSSEEVISYINALKDVNVLVIGDTIIDEYHYCLPLGKSSKSPTISTVFIRSEEYAGGALAIANHVEQYCNRVELVTVLGSQNKQEDVIDKNLSRGVERKFFYRSDSPTNTKRRYLDKYLNTKLFEVTFMNDKFIDSELENEIISYLKKNIDQYDLVLICDFGHGFISPGLQQYLQDSGKYLSINAQTNSNNYGFNYITKYRNAGYISIDEKELRLPFGDNYGKLENLIEKLSLITNCSEITITLGQSGSVFYSNGKYYSSPAFADSVKDSVGAGDAVLSITSLLAYSKAPADLIPFIGNCMGTIAVNIIGNEHPVYKKDLTKFINHFMK
ncbi:MAG: PfkB family carbohydrate kinase [Bacteroidetes bacterium]|nr:PfkB family carbohydrate kinase [Bacteroidota bacterium]